MSKRTVLLSLCTACAVLVSGISASGASAVTAAEWYTCSPGGGLRDFFNPDCTEPVAVGTGNYGHVSFSGWTPLNVHLASTSSIFKATTAGVAITLTGTSLSGSGKLENSVSGAVATPTLTFGSVTANHECKVNGSASASITTKELKATALSASELKLEPASGSTIEEFTLSGCNISALNKTYTVTGSVIGALDGGLTEFTHSGTTSQATLHLNGSINAGWELVWTITGENGSAISITTL